MEEQEEEMAQFQVTFERRVTSTITLSIAAETEQEARDKGNSIIHDPQRHWELEDINIQIVHVEEE